MKNNKILSNLNIAKDNFTEVLNLNDYNLNSLEGYYYFQKAKADELTISGEYVGKTYDNLNIIKRKLNESGKKLIKNNFI